MQFRLGGGHLLPQLLLGCVDVGLLVVLVLDRHLVDQRLQLFQRYVPNKCAISSYMQV